MQKLPFLFAEIHPFYFTAYTFVLYLFFNCQLSIVNCQLFRLVAHNENKRTPYADSQPLDPRLFVNKPVFGGLLLPAK
ncbi:MAG: hypothetical protein CVV03_12105 [Firmicutes bacterium HGW-Firmicutes-8]|nr:MAG: hypothetical protein CVV03_12105 [Firmicutes bacterium HGW-Firmicutes-8]